MRKVIDANFFQAPELESYLRSSSGNQVVLTDYSGMEAYKGNAILNISKSMNILSSYPDQVVVLKRTQAILALRMSPKTMQRRMIDRAQTVGFRQFCKDLEKAAKGSTPHCNAILKLGRDATDQFSRILSDAQDLPRVIRGLSTAYSNEELRTIRTGKKHTEEIVHKFVKHVFETAVQLFHSHPNLCKVPSLRDARHNLAFRVALSCNVLALNWISKAAADTKPEKLRNDMVDAFYVANATFFDGLLTKDKKMAEVHQQTMQYLKSIFLNDRFLDGAI